MNIVLLDGYTTNPGDLSWNDLQSLGNCFIYDRTPKAEIVARASDAEIVLINKVNLTKEIIAQLPKLKYVGVLSTGVNVVDIAAAHERGIVVTNVPAYSTQSVAQMVFALLFELTHHVGHHAEAVRSGQWIASKDFAFWSFPLVELAGKTMGIVGFGSIGQSVANIASALGMDVMVSTRTPKQHINPITFTDIETLFTTSDVVSLHCPHTPQTTHLVNAQRLQSMKPHAFLINTSRGALVDEQALADALNNGRIAGAGVDVLSKEPPAPDNPLLTAKNCIITPHIAWATKAARARLIRTVVENVKAFINGTPINIVR